MSQVDQSSSNHKIIDGWMAKGQKSRIALWLLFLSSLLVFWGCSEPPEASQNAAAEESDHHQEVSEDRLFLFDQKTVILNDFNTQGYILDIGGGGRGVLGELKGEQVIAIDINKRELEEAPAGPLKIVMDATDLKFLDSTFNATTSFFTLMYIKDPDHAKVFNEVFRVLAPGGLFMIWDAVFTERVDKEKDMAVFPLLIQLPDKEIETGYGVVWPEKGRELSHYTQLAEAAGFDVITQEETDQVFYLELMKPKDVGD